VAEQKPSRKLSLRKVKTVREQAEQAIEDSRQPRRLQTTRRKVGAPFRFVRNVLRPLGRFRVVRIIGWILVPPYIRSSAHELRQVTWPSLRESLRLTSAVFVFATIFGLAIALIDYGLDKVFKQVLLK